MFIEAIFIPLFFMFLFFVLSFFWFLRTLKAVLFWIYLWQLKEYHIGRFIDHFRTKKGRELLFNKLAGLKVLLALGLFVSSLFVFFALILLYFLEVLKGFIDIFRKGIKRPVLTKKTILLVLVGAWVGLVFFFLVFRFSGNLPIAVLALLLFDILFPIVISAVVLLLQPLAVLGRNRIIKKAKKKREQFKNLLVIGVTGSYGKTSTKEFLATILSEKFKVLKTKEHQNAEIGIARCILDELDESYEVFVVEMAAYNRGGIKLLCDIAKPKIGVLTGINEQHMATFGSQENIIKAKYELIESLPEDGVAFFNAKNKYCSELYEKTKIKKFLYGKEAELMGTENILGAAVVARELGMAQEEISRIVEKIKNKTGGFQLKEGINGLKIIDATYSANPDGVMVHLEYLKSFPGKKVIVMPCLIELGKSSKEVHKRIGKKIGEVCDLAIITTGDRFKEIQAGVKMAEARPRPVEVLFMGDPKEIFKKIKSTTKPGDVVLLESRVPSKLISLLND